MDYEEKLGLIIAVLLISFSFIGICISTKVEQNTFNKLSHTKVTFIEALFTNLRVMPD